MGEAFDEASKWLYRTVHPEKVVQQAIARRQQIMRRCGGAPVAAALYSDYQIR